MPMDFCVDSIEFHHCAKKDGPLGTACALAEGVKCACGAHNRSMSAHTSCIDYRSMDDTVIHAQRRRTVPVENSIDWTSYSAE